MSIPIIAGRIRRILGNPREMRDRLAQEIQNLNLLLAPPTLPEGFDIAAPLPLLPDPEHVAQGLRGAEFAHSVRQLSAQIRSRRIPLLGITVDTGRDIRWRRDYLSGLETDTSFFRRIPYLDAARVGDHKVIWELNRHQHLVVLAQDWLLHRDQDSLNELVMQLESWLEQNPFQRGINWASALEVAFRTLSWLWVLHLAGAALPVRLRRLVALALYRHGCHLEHNLSYYFSPNTHLLGEAIALHALGALIPQMPDAGRWRETGASVVAAQMDNQVHPDGSHFEHSTYYHVYALDMFLFHALLTTPSQEYREKLCRMAHYLEVVLGPARSLPCFGDDDGGRFFHPFGRHAEYGRATMATCALFLKRNWCFDEVDLAPQAAWWLGVCKGHGRDTGSSPQRFPDCGMTVICRGATQVLVDTGPFGWGSAGHSHSDTLSLVVRRGSEEILIDPGTYTYVGDAGLRDFFRGSAAHSTIRINGLDQAKPRGPFAWDAKPRVRLCGSGADWVEAECDYNGFTHHRRVILPSPDLLLVFDEVRGPAGDHDVDQFWQLGSEESVRRVIAPGAERIDGWRSPAFGRKEKIPVLRVRRQGPLPMRLATAIVIA